jgi:hypothetical protein
VFNSVIIRANDYGCLEKGVNECVRNIENGVKDFDQQAGTLAESTSLSADDHRAISEVVDTMRVFIAGGLEWRYVILCETITAANILLSPVFEQSVTVSPRIPSRTEALCWP